MKKNLLLILLTFFLISNVSAFFPITHSAIGQDLFNMSLDSNNYKSCKNNMNACMVGNILTDASVTFYYSNRDKYIYTHSPSFGISLLKNANSEVEIACAEGAMLHQSQDLISHKQMVPYCIKHTWLPNVIIHPFCEQKLDSILLRENPSLKSENMLALNDFQDCVPLFKRVLQGSEEYKDVDLDAIFAKFIAEVQGSKTGYDVSFNNVTALPFFIIALWAIITLFLLTFTILIIFKKNKNLLNWITLIIVGIILAFFIYLFIANLTGNAFNTLLLVIKPVSNLVPIGNAHGYVDSAIYNSKQFFLQGESFLYNTDASGFTELNRADASIRIPEYIILTILIISLVALIYFNLRRKK